MSESMLPAEADNSAETQSAAQETLSEGLLPAEPAELILGKFRTNEDVIKSYSELEKRFGGFTGAPEEYELPEEVDQDDTFVKTLSEIGKSTNMGQETFSKLMELGEEILSTKADLHQERELEALGPEAGQRLANIDGFMRNNLGDKYEDLKGAVKDAKTVELIESLIKATAPSRIPSEPSAPVNIPTQGDIEKLMQEQDAHGKVIYHYSKPRQQEVEAAIARMHGN